MSAPCAPWPRILFVLFMLAAPDLRADTETTPEPPQREAWRVVLIRSWDSQYPINVLRERALREALVRNAPRAVEIYAEELDPLRFYGPDFEHEFTVLLQKKYRDRKIDLVIASGIEPLEFAAKYRDLLWPDAAIVFNGVIDGTLDRAKLPARTTGVTMVFDVQGTLALGLALVPNARTVYFVVGNSPFERHFLDYAKAELERFDPRLPVRILVGVPRGELLERVAQFEPDSLVFYMGELRDANWQVYPPGTDLLQQVVARSPAPVISAVYTHFVRGGPVGVSSAPVAAHGRAAGLMARAVLEGADPAHLPVRADPAAECQVDWQGLQRWEIAEHRVPASCAIVNRPVAPWKAYFWPLVALVSIIVLQAALIWSLVLSKRRRLAAEADARARRNELARVARISTMGALTAMIAHEVNQAMGAILSNADAAEMMLDQGTLDVTKLREILVDIRSEDMRASEVIRGVRRLLARRELKATALDLNTEIAEALGHAAFDAAHRGVKLVPSFDGNIPPVLGDAVQLQQVFINLVTNAMEASATLPPGEREVRIATRAHAGGVEVTVADRGHGVPPDKVPRLFDSIFTTKDEGMGLGLSIVRSIVDMHGGRVVYEPNLHQGAIFRVWLPVVGT